MRTLNQLTFACACSLLVSTAAAQTNLTSSNETYTVDLPTVLRLASAQNLDVQIAREKLTQARASYNGAVMQFLPWLSPGVSFRRHDNFIQDVAGNIIEVHKESYAPGITVNAQVDLGDALYKSLAARQTLNAADHALEAQRQITLLSAIQGYYDLAKAQAQIAVDNEALRISQNLEQQLISAVSAGIAYKGDQLRAQVQTGQTALSLRQALEQQRVAGARLAEVLRLDPAVELVAKETELVPLSLVASNAALSPLVEQALVHRPELQASHSLVAAARSAHDGTTVGPLIPSLGGQAFIGGLGGGIDNQPHPFGQSEDYIAYLSWRIGPGGLFDFSRTRLYQSRLEDARLGEAKLHDQITREVVESITRFRSLSEQLTTVKHNLELAAEAEKLAEQRQEFAVGAVLEDIQTQQDLTRARNDFANIVAEFNKAQYALLRAIGNLATDKPAVSSLK
ncbi:TolC family protein [Pedosphaera parvula]|uniref:Outer membrane efflux protein n=1 Tax=Pedosphaera parvula (strain Ellin514) TaxID=320771 RepID=B9XRK2_PEDPL|nr:TolC family protein [Pedosphaera parvula]EEF57521.1 outer membrane efflux protein [Pedosphaera parvula Ellin514]